MDAQYVAEMSHALGDYITKYVTKADKSHLSNEDFGLDHENIRSKLWKFAFRSLKSREMGAYEAVDRFFLTDLYKCNHKFQFISTVFPEQRRRMLRNIKDLEKGDQQSTNIFYDDYFDFYRHRPDSMEDMTLEEFVASTERAYRSRGVSPSTYDKAPYIKLKGDNGIMKLKKEKSLVYHNNFDPHVQSESYYYAIQLLFMPWRHEKDIKGTCPSYEEAFKRNVASFPRLKEYHITKMKIIKSKNKVEEEVSKKLQQIEQEGVAESGADYEETEDDFTTALDQVLNDFEDINNKDNISTDKELTELVKTLNPDQRRIYDTITKAIDHSVSHAINECSCDSFQPLLLYVSGYGGTGKSYLIKAIMSWAYVKSRSTLCKIVLAAPTGISAAGISGMTLHSALSLPIEHHGKLAYKPLAGQNLQQFQACFRNVHCMMIDEISMVSNTTLLHIHLRLSEIFGARRRSDTWFGGQNVVVFGDLLQLPPVKGDEVFVDLSEKAVKAAIGTLSTNISLWSHFSYDELTINQRQKHDVNADFKDCLSRIRIGNCLQSDIDLLSTRKINLSDESPLESIVDYYIDLLNTGESPVCLLPTRNMVIQFNNAVLNKRSHGEIVDIYSLDELTVNLKI